MSVQQELPQKRAFIWSLRARRVVYYQFVRKSAMEQITGFKTITYRFRLQCEREEWLHNTKDMYNRVLQFYYEVLLEEPELEFSSNMRLMRQLELLTVGSKQERQTKYPFPFDKVPLYFRRAAINDAIRLYKSFSSGKEHGANQAKAFHSSPVYYKGMYREFTPESVELKLYTGERWSWINCSLDACGREFDGTEQFMSPVLKVGAKRTMLHVPVQKKVEDVRTVNERLSAKELICAVAFPSNDCMAVAVLLDTNGEFIKSKFIRGGNELAHRRSILMRKMKENRAAMKTAEGVLPLDENKAIKEKIRRITDNAAHKVSREIVEFCKEHHASVIVMPNYKNALDLNSLGYLSATNYDWLGRRIISYVKYKAFGDGIVSASVSTKNIAAKCYQCGENVKKYNGEATPGIHYYGGKNFVCPNGHKGNSYFNSAMNVGLNFLRERTHNQLLEEEPV